MKRFLIVVFCLIAVSTRGDALFTADGRIAVVNSPEAPINVTRVATEELADTDAEERTVRVTLTVIRNSEEETKAGVRINSYSSSGECKGNSATVRPIRETEEQWVVRLVRRQEGDVTVISTFSPTDKDRREPKPFVKELAAKLLGKDPKKMGGPCRFECRAFEVDCNVQCGILGFPAACVCCSPIASPGPCDYMECFCCSSSTNCCHPCP